nr:hypothetical protein [Tanacetum cinerariifolium]
MVEDDPDVIHVDTSSDLALFTSLNDLEIAALHIDGQSIDVDAPPDIIDVVDEDDDIIDEEDPIPLDLADFVDEDLVNLDINDGVNVVYSSEEEYCSLVTQFDLRPHIESDRWPQIYAGIQQHLQKIYNGKKVTLKERYWVPEEDGTYDLERIRRGRLSHISEMETSTTREYPSLIHTFFLTHIVGGIFLNPEDKALYDEVLRLQGLGSNTLTGVPYTEDEIMEIVRGGKQRGHIPGVGRVLLGQGKMLSQLELKPEYDGGSESGGCGDDEPGDDEDGGEDEDDRASNGGTFQVLDVFCQDRARSFLPHLKACTLSISLGSKSRRSGSRNKGSGRCEDDEPRDDEDDSEGEEDEDDS